MVYYRIALQEPLSHTWRWKSCLLTSLHSVFGVLHMYRYAPKERLRVFLTTSPEHMERMLSLANQGLLSTAITADQLWDRQRVSWIEIKRLELELGAGGDHDQPYTWDIPPLKTQVLAWTKLLAKRERGDLFS